MNLRLAYACFLFCGLSWFTIGTGVAVLTTLPPNEGLAAGLGIGIAVPLMIGTFMAMFAGMVVGLFVEQGPPPMVVLSVLSLVTPFAVLRDYSSQNISTALAITGGLIITLIAGRGLWRNL